VKSSILVLAGILGGFAASTGAQTAKPGAGSDPARQVAPADDTVWKAWGGEIQFRWNRALARDYGFTVSEADQALKRLDEGIDRLQVRDSNSISLAVRDHSFAGFRGGRLAVRGGFDLGLADGAIALREFTLQPNPDDAMILDVVANDGIAWFYIDRMMYKFEDEPARLSVLAMDLRIAPRLAERIGQPDVAGHVIAAMSLTAHVHGEGFAPLAQPKAPSGCGKWHECEVTPGGPQYQADVFMQTFSAQYFRRDGQADGPGGSNGRAVWVPSSTLRNNRNNGSATATIPGDPLGTSAALHSANVPWYTKFSGNFDPHGNDQHPYLIWNLYRIGADGRISQIGRSGVKHAWLTTNGSCDENPGNGHILGRGCSDTYGTGNNDDIDDLGPRSEIVPAKGLWGRCGSFHDRRINATGAAGCDGQQDSGAPCSNVGAADCSTWSFRLSARESHIDPGVNAGATYLFESWYIVRDDVNIFNTMQTRPVTFSWSGTTWPIANGSPLLLGPAIDRWMPRGTSTATQRSSDIDRPEGHARVAVKVADLGGGNHRYDYTVMNFDFAEEVITGSNPNLTVLSNDGFTDLTVLLPAGANVTDIEFDDGDIETANNWTSNVGASSIKFSSVPGAALNWGMMYRFSFTANAAPIESDLRLTTAQAGTPDHADVLTLGPGGTGIAGFTVGGNASGLAGTDGADLELNGAEALTVPGNGTFRFNTAFQTGENYAVTIERQPRGRSCDLSGESGTIAGANVNSVLLDCVGFGVRGTVSGVTGTDGVDLRLNGVETITRTTDGAFSFATPLMGGEGYTVTVARHPAGKVCEVSAGSGVIFADVTNVVVECEALPPDQVTIGGTLGGLDAGRNVTLHLNGTVSLPLSGNGAFVFPGTLPVGGNFAVTVSQHPVAQECTVAQGSGVVPPGGVSNVQVTCNDRPVTQHSVRFALSNLGAGKSVRMQLNGANTLQLTSNGSYVFGVLLSSGTDYHVTVSSQPAGQSCTVTNGDGTIDFQNIDNVTVACANLPPTYSVGGTLSGLPQGESVNVMHAGFPSAMQLTENGPFQFAMELQTGTSYNVLAVNPSVGVAQCQVTNGTGTIQSQDVTNVQITCTARMFTVSGTISGLQQGQTVTLSLNNGETLAGLGNGPFAFSTGLPNNAGFAVAVMGATGGAQCDAEPASGTVSGDDVDDVEVACEALPAGMFSDGFE
jgi:hypothetical protein